MIRAIPTLLLLLIAPAALAAGPLQRNPFRVPIELGGPTAQRAVSQSGSTPESFDLRATLVAGGRSFVNLGGSILSLGEEIAGYRLVSVREGEAVFWKDGESIRLSLNDDDEQAEGPDER